MITLRTKLSGAVYNVIGPVCVCIYLCVCGFICLFVGLYHDNSKLRASIFTKLGLYRNCFSGIKWICVFSATFQIRFGVRQGSVLSPFLFAIYLGDILILRSLTPRSFVVLYAVYADDILLITFG